LRRDGAFFAFRPYELLMLIKVKRDWLITYQKKKKKKSKVKREE